MSIKINSFLIQQYSKGTSWFTTAVAKDMNDLQSKFRRLRKVSPKTKFRVVLKQTVILTEDELFRRS